MPTFNVTSAEPAAPLRVAASNARTPTASGFSALVNQPRARDAQPSSANAGTSASATALLPAFIEQPFSTGTGHPACRHSAALPCESSHIYRQAVQPVRKDQKDRLGLARPEAWRTCGGCRW